MELETIFYMFNPWWEEQFIAPGIIRNNYLSLLKEDAEKKEITFLTGLRRVGKTTLIKQTIQSLLEKNVPSKNIFFLSLDHSALAKLSILELIEKYRSLHGISLKEKIFLFLDEVQYHDSFEQDLKVLHDHENVKIFASGSNSLILKDKRAFLTGRNRNVVINPLSFEEYLLFKKIELKNADHSLKQKYFESYLEDGGLPEYVLTKDPEKIINLVNNILYKDIIAKYGLKNGVKIEELFLLLCERVGKRVTYNKLANILALDVETISAYISYFEETFLIHQVNRYAKSLNEVIRSPKKIYIADNGIRSVLVGFKDKGALWENIIYLKLKKHKVNYFFENEHEIDFIVQTSVKRKVIAIEAKYKEILDEKELRFFNESKFSEKMIINTIKDLERIEILE
ncbi:ATP-binding protein [Candidatus Woesearchaeota archaeon]|nr:ATP-binding protein [Candidatus Woesearchaeota archaeon]